VRATRLATGLALVVTLAVLALVAPATATGAAEQSSSLPPSARKALVAIFDPKVKRFGLRVTRASLVNPEQERDAHGTHLAIYVEPIGDRTPDDYIDGTVDVTKVFMPYVFERWKSLKSFDVCQEPRAAVDPRPVPTPETQFFATRAGSKLVDWKTVDVATMIHTSRDEAAAAGTQRSVRFSLFVTQHLQNTPAYQQAAGTDAATTSESPTVRDYG
jgi:hypothetical protein